MKRFLCALLCLMMVMCAAGSLAAVNYTLPEKMDKQLQIGSGLKGSLIFRGEGTSPLMLAVDPLLDTELQLRGMKSGGEGHYYLYQAGADEAQIGLTELYDKGDAIYFRSDLLPDQVFMIPGLASTVDLIFPTKGGNPSLASAVLRWMQLGDRQNALLNPVVEKLTGEVELWAAQFSSVSDVRTTESGQSVIDLVYTIPMSEVRKEIVALMVRMITDSDGQALLNALLNEDQKAVFDNAYLDYFYAAAMEAQDNDFDVQYTRTISTLGTQISSIMELPLDENQTGYQSITIEENGSLTTFTLTSEERILSFMIGSGINLAEVDTFSCWLVVRPNPAAEPAEGGERHALQIKISHNNIKSTDEENRDHERISWNIEATRDVSRLPEGENAEDYPEEEPRSLNLNLHFFSRYSQNSPTTMEISGSLKMKDFTLSVEGQMKTASPWIFKPFEVGENPTDLTKMTVEEREVKLAELLAAAGEQLTKSAYAEETEAPATEEPQEAEEEAETAETENTEETTETPDTDENAETSADDSNVPEIAEAAELTEALKPTETPKTAEDEASEEASESTAAADTTQPAETTEPAVDSDSPAQQTTKTNDEGIVTH